MLYFQSDDSIKEEKGGIFWDTGQVFVSTIMT